MNKVIYCSTFDWGKTLISVGVETEKCLCKLPIVDIFGTVRFNFKQNRTQQGAALFPRLFSSK